MTKKEKILHSYITNIIEDENPKNIFILTSQDISKLIKSCLLYTSDAADD